MLIRFTVNNFLSFNSEQEFSMNPGAVKKYNNRIAKFPEQSILKFAALYGANASGKTNLVKAIDFSKNIVVEGISQLDTMDKHYKLDPKNIDLPTKFEFDLRLGDKYYGYGFSVNLKDKKILNEWLVELKKDKDIPIFERESSSNYKYHNFTFKNNDEKEKFDLQIELVNDIGNTLLISEIFRRKNNPRELKILEELYNWFKRDLIIIYTDSVLKSAANLFTKSDEKLVELLKYFDTGICGYELAPSSLDQIQQYLPKIVFDKLKQDIEEIQEHVINRNENTDKLIAKGSLMLNNHLFKIDFDNKIASVNELLFRHNNSSASFTFGEESDGTRRLIELLGILYNESNSRTIIIDELDRSLHPQMTIKFVKTFLEQRESLMTQLIITTHESNLMDLDILRRDEIWFVDRDIELNESKLYSLEKFKVHNTKRVEKDYLIGRYGAVPLFRDFDSYLENSVDIT